MSMTQTQQHNIPSLRFPEFNGEWLIARIGSLATKIGSGVTPKGGSDVYQDSGIPLLRSQNVRNNKLYLADVAFISEEINAKMKGSAVKPHDVLLNITGASIGRSCVVPSDIGTANVNQHVCIIRLVSNGSPDFLQSFLTSHRGQKLIFQSQSGSGREGLNFENIKTFKSAFPSLTEQQKIASFLSSVDRKIEQLGKKKALLEQYKKGMMQKLFSQELRFKDAQGNDFPDWEEKRLGEVAERRTLKNSDVKHTRVLTNSAVRGVIDQGDYFDHAVANAENLGGYYIVEMGDFVYNPRISVSAPVGPIKRNDLGTGVMSPLYSVFRFNSEDTEFYRHYYSSSFWYRYMKTVANYGARHDRMAISTKDFMNMPLPNPCPDEQQKIADFLSSIDQKIDLVSIELNHAKTFKKGLLQQMFI